MRAIAIAKTLLMTKYLLIPLNYVLVDDGGLELLLFKHNYLIDSPST